MYDYILAKRKQFPKLTEIIRFLIIGGIATLIDMVVMFLITYLPYKSNYSNIFDAITNPVTPTWLIIVGTAVGFVVGLIFNYVFSVLYVYDNENKHANTPKSVILFTVLSVIGLFIQTFGMFIFNSILNINEWIVKCVLIVVVLIFNYITRKKFIFNENTLYSNNENASVEKMPLKTIWLNIAFISSAICFTMLYGRKPFLSLSTLLAVAVIIVVLTALLFIFERHFLSLIKFDNKIVLTLSILVDLFFLSTAYNYSPCATNEVKLILCTFSSFAGFVYSYFISLAIYNLIKKFLNGLTKNEKKFLIISIIVGCCFCIFTNITTRIFIAIDQCWDTLLSFDTGEYTISIYNFQNAYNNVRHYFVTLCSIPLLILPYYISILFPISPLLTGIIYQLEQVVVICVSAVLLLRIIKKLKSESSILSILPFILSICITLNTLTVEKFIIALFYSILTIYFTMNNSNYKWLALILSVGTLTTNIILLPFILLYNKTSWKKAISETVCFAFLFAMIFVVFGQVELILATPNQIIGISNFTSLNTNLTFFDNLNQTLIFVSSMFIFPKFKITEKMVIQADAHFNIFAILGIIILLLCVIGYIFKYKDKIAIFSILWIVFMFLLLTILGWGSARNEMFIYSTSFIFPIYYLLTCFFQKVFKGKKLKIVVSIIFITISIYNFIQFIELLKFTIPNYPGVF